MTLNGGGYSYNKAVPGAVNLATRTRLEGTERGLDAIVGLVILVAELFVGLLAIGALYEAGLSAGSGSNSEQLSFGLGIAVFGGGAVVLLTTIIYLSRVVVGRRSWPATLWGIILMSLAIVVGYFVMFA